ncbi:MAG TPA: M13 family metallopeptidase [Thermoanaerobaculia bacterium]|nr:M13 family metallopeptidase [Thermoanaerobaculia bacterium]
MTDDRRFIAPRAVAILFGLAFAPAAFPEPGPAATAPGIDLDGIDRSVAPGDNFFAYANGTWLKTTEIPADRSSYGIGSMLDELTSQRTAALIKEAASSRGPAGSEARKIGDYYSSYMDEAAIEAKGLRPLEPALARIAGIADKQALARAIGGTLRADVDVLNATNFHTGNLLGLWVAQDLDEPAKYSPFLLQGGLGMPDREYYLDSSPRMAEIRLKYQAHIAAVLKLARVADAEAKAARIFDLEHSIARTHWGRAESEDVVRGNNHWTRQDFEKNAPGLDWAAFFAEAGLGREPVFVVWQPSAVTGISALVAAQPLETWKDYLVFRSIERASPFLPKAFGDEAFAFYGQVLTGTPKQRDRWKRGVAATNAALGEAVGKLYVRRYFPAPEKARAQEMVRNLIEAFRQRIDRLDWMAPETKARARAKLATLKVGVGYPDKWRDYSGLEIVRGDVLGNAERAGLFEYRRNLKKLGQPIDRDEWVMTPQTVNAVNLPVMNAMNFPAAILQPPYFDSARTAAMNYGATGATIGHEVSHSFDDQGALFDETGRLHNWWTREDFAHFQAAAAALVKQYDGYRPFPDLAVNGKLTLSENIADVAGLAAAYDAYRLSLGGKEAPVVQGLSGDKQFFLAFTQSWRQKIREPALRQRILTDSHSPGEYRADTVRNLDAWYDAFDVKPGEKLYLAPAGRVRVW